MSLRAYQNKRDFAKSPEPRGASSSDRKNRDTLLYVVQKHDASQLHYDLRLELGGALKSWAVPKGPSEDPEDKRLAVQVEDHPVDYGDFEGVIPQGEYGAGTVMVWDRGVWMPEHDDPATAIDDGKLSFTLHGVKLHGSWALVRMTGKRSNDGKHWLLIKHDDDTVDRRRTLAVDAAPNSVKSGRSLDQIASDESNDDDHNDAAATATSTQSGETSGSDRRRDRTSKNQNGPSRSRGRSTSHEDALRADRLGSTGDRASRASSVDVSTIDGIAEASTLRDPSPMLCTLVDAAPTGDDWIHEIKFDGYRLLARKTASGTRLETRRGKDWTKRFQPIARAIDTLDVDEAIIDGEACIVDDDGRTSFQQLQNAIKAGRFNRLRFFVFDLLFIDGWKLTGCSLLDRKRVLRSLVLGSGERDNDDGSGVIRYTDHIRGDGPTVHANACGLGLEGIISKRVDATYVSKRTNSWLKVKCSRRQEFVIVGFTDPSGSRVGFGSLLLGVHDDSGDLVYAGKCGTGYSDRVLEELGDRLASMERKTSPLATSPSHAELNAAHWVTPKLVCEVSFTEWTADRRLRHPAFEGLREDKSPEDVTMELPDGVATSTSNSEDGDSTVPNSQRIDNERRRNRVAGVALSHPERVMFPDQGLTKRDLAVYFRDVADWLLPFVKGRPLSTVRCPEGRDSECFFQKHTRETFDEHIDPIPVDESGETRSYIGVSSVEGLVTLAQFGVLEIHPWGSKKDKLDAPDSITFDLDPGEGVGFEAVKAGARLLRDRLDHLGLQSFLKTSGGKGLHVLIPIRRTVGWDEAKAFARDVAKQLARDEPKRFVATMSKQRRKGKVFIDYLRNARGSTSVAAYSPRARPGAPVSTPLRWDELSALDSSAAYTVRTLPRRLRSLNDDPWADFASSRQSLTRDRRDAVRG